MVRESRGGWESCQKDGKYDPKEGARPPQHLINVQLGPPTGLGSESEEF